MSRPNVWAGKICLVDGCDEPVKCRGVCLKHYNRAKRSGTLERKRRPSFADVKRAARAEAVIALIKAGLLDKTVDPRRVCAALELDVDDLSGVLSSRSRRWDGPRANVDRTEAPPGRKWCSQCRSFRLLQVFHRDKNSPDGRCHMCKPCKLKYQRAYRRKSRRAA